MAAAAYLTVDEFGALLDGGAYDELVRDHLITGVPWYFREDDDLFGAFCGHFAAGLDVPTENLCLVGSGRTGFAVSPDAFPRPFHDESDLDVAIVSSELFDAAWLSLVKWGHPRRFTLPAGERKWMVERQGEIFWGWLRPDRLRFRGLRFPGDLGDLRQVRTAWFDTFRSVGAQFPGSDLARREVTGRLYRSWDHLVRYQSEGLRRLQYQRRQRSATEAKT